MKKNNKKRLVLVIIIILVLIIVGIGLYNNLIAAKKKSKNFFVSDVTVEKNGIGNTYTFKELPLEIFLDDKKFTLDSINFYQDYENEKYYFYAIAELDFSNLNKADISYLEKDDNFRLSINIDSEENHYDNEYMSLLSITNKNNIMYFSFALMSGDIYESLENGEYTIACNIQKDTYYLFNQEISSLDKSENIDKDIYNDMLNGINRINNNFFN